MDEIVHAEFASASLSFIPDITNGELIDHIVENIDAYTESMQAAAMLETSAVADIFRDTDWQVWFCRRHHLGATR